MESRPSKAASKQRNPARKQTPTNSAITTLNVDAMVKTALADRPKLNPTFQTIECQVDSWLRLHKQYRVGESLVPAVFDTYVALDAPKRLRRREVPSTLKGPELRSLSRALATLTALDSQVSAVKVVTDAVSLVPVVAYYSVYQAIVCERTISGGRVSSHAAAGAHYATLMDRGFVPTPYDVVALGSSASTFHIHSISSSFKDFTPKVAARAHVLRAQNDRDVLQRVGQSLLTTRREGRTRDYMGARRAGRPTRHPTTIVDYLFRLRHRAQYADCDAFNGGASADSSLRAFAFMLCDLAYAIATPLLLNSAMRLGEAAVTDFLRYRTFPDGIGNMPHVLSAMRDVSAREFQSFES